MINKNKRKLKGEPKLKLNLNEEQKEVKTLFYAYDVNFIHGDFGSGKTLVACAIALSSYRKKEYNKIVIARPITKNMIGYLPGDIKDKLDPYVSPIVHNFNMLQEVEKTERMMDDGIIEILPVDFAKGITYTDSVVIVDEYEDLNYEDFRMMLSRLGRDSKIIFCGSKEQIDRSIGSKSCIYSTIKLEDSNIVGYSTLKANHRNNAITEVLQFLEDEK
jgi:phosphate starvation-inducible PhoH-like protein